MQRPCVDRREFLRSLGSGAVVAIAGCLDAGASDANEFDIGMSTRAFRPATIEVAPGTTVVWRNTSSHAHTVTAYDGRLPDGAEYFASGGFESEAAAREAWRSDAGGSLYQGDEFEHTFEVEGEHHYVCIPHEPSGMVGTVVVTEDATGTPRDG